MGLKLAELHDALHSELRAASGSSQLPEQESLVFATESNRIRFTGAHDGPNADLRRRMNAEGLPWVNAGIEERRSFRAANSGLELAAVMTEAFGREGVIPRGPSARNAFLKLVAWDARYLWVHPSARLLLRNAQLSGDRVLLQRLGHALWQNRRYGNRGKRGQALLTRVLVQLQFGDPNAYRDLNYRKRVCDGLIAALEAAKVPEEHEAMKLLATPAHFDKHLRRIGALPLRRRRT